MEKSGKSVQIPQELFFDLVRYFLAENHSEEQYEAIRGQIRAKFDALVRRETYTAYKTATSPEDAERARQAYLDMVGMGDAWRWNN